MKAKFIKESRALKSEGYFTVNYGDMIVKSKYLMESWISKNVPRYPKNSALKNLRSNQLIRSYTYQD